MSAWQVPRCEHGNIVLGCPDPDCAVQNAYLAAQVAAIRAHYDRQAEEVGEYVKSLILAAAAASGTATGRPE